MGVLNEKWCKKITFVDSDGVYRSVVNNDDQFNALSMVAGEFGVVTSIEVALEKGKLNTNNFLININTNKLIDLLLKIQNNIDYEGNLTFVILVDNCVIISHSSTENLDYMYSYRLMTETFRLEVNPITNYIFNLLISNLDNVEVGDVYNFTTDSEADFIIDLDDNLTEITKHYDIFYIMISNPKYKTKFNNKIMIGLRYNKENHKQLKNLIDTYYPENVKYLNCPLYGEPISNYISEFSPLSYSKLLKMKNKMDPTNLFITRYNAFN